MRVNPGRVISRVVCTLVLSLLSQGAAGEILYEAAKLVASDGDGTDLFGLSASISGDVVLVGANWDSDYAYGSGSAYVFRRIPGSPATWAQEAKLLPPDPAELDEFGVSVSVYGDVAVVGSFRDDDLGNSSGSAYVFRKSGTSWSLEQKLLASDGASSDFFGISVSVSGDVIAIGAHGDNNNNGFNAGSAYIFRWNGTEWMEEQKLLSPEASGGNELGYSVSLSGDIVAVSALYGPVDVFRWNGVSWQAEQTLEAQGLTVAASGDVIIVGAAQHDHNGSANVYRWNGSSWVHQQVLVPLKGGEHTHFGTSVSVSGDAAVVGAIWDDENGNRAGSAYVFRWDGFAWVEEQKLLPSDGVGKFEFGWSAAVDGNVAVVGAIGDGFGVGAAYVFNLACEEGYYGPLCLPCPGGSADLEIPDCAAPIPTLSGWGLVVLVLLMLVAGKVSFRCRATARS